MERRLLLVFVLTFVVILLFQPILKKYLPQPSPATQNQAPAPSQPAPAPAQMQVSQPTPEGATEKTATKRADSESQTVIESDLYRITFTNRGAQAASWVLKKFDDDHGKPLDW